MIKNIKIVFLVLVIGIGAFAVDPNKPWDVNIVSFGDFGTSGKEVTGGYWKKTPYMAKVGANAVDYGFAGFTPSNWDVVSSYYQNYSQAVANLTSSNANFVSENGGKTEITLSKGVNVLRIASETFNTFYDLTINGGDDTSRLFIDITDSGAVNLQGTTWHIDDGSKILINLASATSIINKGDNYFSILAPYATFENSNAGDSIDLKGNLIAKNIAGGAYNIHPSNTFKGDGIVTVVPEPSSFILSIFAFASLVLKRKRK